MGAVVARTLGPGADNVPPYIYIGRDIDTSDSEKQFISEAIGPGFYGVQHAPFMIPDATAGLATLTAAAGMTTERLDRRLEYPQNRCTAWPSPGCARRSGGRLHADDGAGPGDDGLAGQAGVRLCQGRVARHVAAYEPQIERDAIARQDVLSRPPFRPRAAVGPATGRESGARFVQVEYQYGPFKGFDMHENGQRRMVEMKKQIDSPIAQLIRDLADRGLLERTLVVVATEFGRTIANQPKAGVEPDGFAESQSGDKLVIEDPKMYGFHGHFSSGNALLFFGGGFKRGLVYGRTADRAPDGAHRKPRTPGRRPRHDLPGAGHPARHRLRDRRPPLLRHQGRQGPTDRRAADLRAI